MLPPERAVWPLPPRPEVLPWPPPSPQPTRFLRCTAPGTFLSSWSFMDFLIGAPPRSAGTELGFKGRGTKAGSARFANARDVFRETQLEQAVERRMHDGDVIRGTHRFREDVLHAGGFEDSAHAATRD